MDRAHILNAIRNAPRKADSFSEHESETMSRLKGYQVTRGVTKLEHFSGSQRRMLNQHRTGVLRSKDLINGSLYICDQIYHGNNYVDNLTAYSQI
jgi:hypothetical protein